jgi:hypothetical protein
MSDPAAAPPAPEKRVRFSPVTEVYRDIPWAYDPADRSFDANELLLQTRLKDSVCALRTEIKADEALTLPGVILLIISLLVLFFVIWFVVRKVLLLEVDSAIGGPKRNALEIS